MLAKSVSRLLRGAAATLILTTSPTLMTQAQAAAPAPAPAQPQQQRPDILVIMGDDVGWFNFGAYHRSIMAGKTPNLDTLAAEGMMFTNYYAEASCTVGRAAFITGELPIRTGLTTVDYAGADRTAERVDHDCAPRDLRFSGRGAASFAHDSSRPH